MKLCIRQGCVGAITGHQLGMCAFFYDTSGIQYDQAVSPLDCGQAVRDNNGGSTIHGVIKRGLHKLLALAV